MKIMLLLMLASLPAGGALAQTKQKKDPPPTQKEMEDLLRQAQEAIKNIDPETKRMMDSMGIKMPGVPQSAPKIGDKALAEAWEEQTRIVPKKDAARIAAIPSSPLADAAVPGFVQRVHTAVSVKISASEKNAAQQVYDAVKTKSATSTAEAATGLWMNGNTSMAVYVMGKAALDNPTDPDNLNNYAAFLTMTGVEQAAIPLLANLNKKYPNNSTILNNIGQAWFGLGDMDKAIKYLDSAIFFFALHPQANFTKCLILESKGGDPKKAIDALKRSIAEAYSKEKESKLRDLGYELDSKDINWDFPIPADALGLEKFHLPAYPKNTGEAAKLEQEWKAFRKACDEKIKELEAKNVKLRAAIEQQAADVQKELLNAVKNKQRLGQPRLVPFYHYKAMKKLMYLIDDKDGSVAHNRMRVSGEEENARQQAEQLRLKMQKEIDAVKIKTQGGEGQGNVTDEEYCRKVDAIINKYLPLANKLLFDARIPAIEFRRKELNNQAYFNLFAVDPLTYEYMKNGFKINWLNELSKSRVHFWRCNSQTPKQTGDDVPHSKTLPDFDDIHCDRHVEFYFYSTRLTLDCSRLTSEIILPVLRTSVTENLNNNEVIRGTVQVGYFKGAELKKGPVKGEFKAEAGVAIEFDKSGVTDVGVRGKAVAGSGFEARYGWNSGGSLEGKGIFKGINLK